ncbi:unnamed protein product [Menidia menidia]|uniref:(Atlantic silverside) hypothetical protein n=1 Tax=Menidia menidia TaxID=238744 RepID=A0A8S4AYK7_9TELE|nr:unnamed protein product [Menidia menidia]
MGRLDDAAKHKVVELRKAGLSFRKIKAVLELENIKVSAQAIYLYLRELQGRPPGRVRPVEAGANTLAAQVPPRTGASRESWSNIHIQNLLREASQNAGFAAADFAKQTPNSEASANSSGSGEACGGSRPEPQRDGNKEENDIQIVSVTSLAQHGQQRLPHCTATRAETSSASSTLAASGSYMKRRVTLSPATSSMLAARKRLLDKALSHRTKSFHQVASLLRRDPSNVQSSDFRSVLTQPRETFDLTTEKTAIEGQPAGDCAPRRFPTQRPGPCARSTHPPPRFGIRLPNRPIGNLTSSAPGAPILRLQTPSGSSSTRNESNPSPQQAVQDTGGRGGLQDQIQTLGSEVRSLGLAVKMLIEQQCRLEREHSQQTQIQKQILSTLQMLSSRMVHGRSAQQQQHSKTPSPSSFGLDTFSFNQGSYTQCSQTQPSYNSMESSENVEAFKLPGLRPTSINGFQPCSSADSLPLTHTPPQTQAYAGGYPQQSSQTLITPYTQSYVSTFTQSHQQSFRTPESKSSDFSSSCSSSSFQDCSVSTQQDQQINTIKVEGP